MIKKYLIMICSIILVIIAVVTVYMIQPIGKQADSSRIQNRQHILSEKKSSIINKVPHSNSITTHAQKAPVNKVEPNEKPRGIKDSMAELRHERELTLMFEEEAKETFPLLSIQTANPMDTGKKVFGPKRGEIWIRIKPENSKEFKKIMAGVADLYKNTTGYEDPVTVVLWVGNRIWAKFQYPDQEQQSNFEFDGR